MRPRHAAGWLAASLASWLLWPACGNGSAGGTGAGGASNCTGGPFQVACEACLEASCCAEAAACYNDPACSSCTETSPPEPSLCARGVTKLWDAFIACVLASCEVACIPPSTCNPVTNDGCQSPDACDLDQDGVYACFPAASDARGACGACSNANGPPCDPTLHCLEAGGTTACARYCCDDGDCAGGICDTTTVPGGVGLCVQAPDHLPDGGAAPVCDAPAIAASNGACFTVGDGGADG